MRLSSGSSVGPYRILASLGAGGMGEVYRAEHVRLGREVALKVLHELTSGNPEYRSRFEREARVLASLNHPNIATLHGLEEVGDSTLLEMELVPGETLAERLFRGPMPPGDTLPIFKQIAQALEAAHERGIIHRDLKPSNVKVTPEGRVKVLDFGLAKSFEPENKESSGNAAVFTTTTQPGVILGTVAYMSPEHIRGKALDRRTDIWAFGCMYYEAISGKPPFASETVSDTLAAVLREEPDWRVLTHAPIAVQRLIKRCLKKDPTARLHDIADAGLEIEDAVVESAPLVVHVPGVDAWRFSRKQAGVVATAVLGTLAVLVAFGYWMIPRMSPLVPAVSRVVVPVPSGHRVESGGLAPLAISPDGTRLVYVAAQDEGRTQLLFFTNAHPHLPMSWARDGLTLAFEERKPGADHDIWVLTRGSEPWAFQRTENDESSPVFSPDGKWLSYVSDESGRRSVWVQPFPGPGAKWLVSPDGGTEPAWSRDGTTLFFRRANQLVSVPITPGAEFRWGRPQRVLEFRYATLDGARNDDVSPDSNTFVVVRSEGAADADQFNVVLNWFADLRSRK